LIDFFEESYTPIGFSNWIKKIDGKLTYIDGNVSNQINMVSDETGNCIVDFVGKYENINEDFNFIRSKLNFNCKDLEFKNKSYHNHYSYYYDSESIDIIRRRYKSDIDFFGFDYSDEH
jgi:hypothetical protein